MRSVWAMVCGTIRDQVDFSLIMDYLMRCREKGIIQGIVVSTWEHEFDQLGDLEAKLALNDVAVVMSPTNDDMVANMHANSVNYWRQAKQMQAALDLIPTDAIVIKTRTDRALPATKRLISMLDEPDPLPLVAEEAQTRNLTQIPRVFKHKIAIFKARTGRILQFTDFAFMGYSPDIRKLINFDIADLTFTRPIVANIQFFIYPFIRDYPIIRDYYRVVDFYPLLKDLNNYTENGGIMFPKFFERVYAAYFGLLVTHFRIGSLGEKSNLGEITLPIEFSALFHSGEGKHLLHDALGVTLNSQEILDKFLGQPFQADDKPKAKHWWQKNASDITPPQVVVEQEATKQVLRNVKNLSSEMLDRVTNEELEELKEFTNNQSFSPNHWLRVKRPILDEQVAPYKSTFRYELPGISDEERANLWQECEESTSANQVLYRYWLHHEIKPEDTPAYLMSTARTDNRFSILTMTRLLRKGLLDNDTKAEILRINNFFGSFHVRHGRMNAETACYIMARYMYLVENNQKIPAMANEQANYVFKRYLSDEFESFKTLLKEPNALIPFFDKAIDERQETKKAAACQRAIEVALEVTHDSKYWDMLEKRFNGRYEGYEYAYQYGISWKLI
ncbi:hypothetical protein [Levilactobacillus cerevisiae]|uniref:hypothetical protein n=1 Tax=Levilactobacillus cerevisiae TaxID=1704076 RepID=UPI000F7A55FC|nr:hypothetical protein [Levilactobacillus cerevisiae]